MKTFKGKGLKLKFEWPRRVEFSLPKIEKWKGNIALIIKNNFGYDFDKTG